LSAGNCVIIKPSEISAATAEALAKLIPQYLDKECVKVKSLVFLSSVLDPDPHGSALIWLSWIRIRIGNADPDPDRGAWKLIILDFGGLDPALGSGSTRAIRNFMF
jgi:hypothetical protein